MTGTMTLTLEDNTTIEVSGVVTSAGSYMGSPTQQINIIDEETGKTASVILSDTKWNDLEPCWNRDLIPQQGTQGTQGTQGK